MKMIVCCLLLVLVTDFLSKSTAIKPHIIYFLVDDLGFVLSYYSYEPLFYTFGCVCVCVFQNDFASLIFSLMSGSQTWDSMLLNLRSQSRHLLTSLPQQVLCLTTTIHINFAVPHAHLSCQDVFHFTSTKKIILQITLEAGFL